MMEKTIELDELKQIQVEMLKNIDAFCKENKITYFLALGTLLGAVRHHGFIPWDDDIDIMMPREDFKKLLQIFPKEGNYRFMTYENTKNFPYPYGKIVDVRTVKSEMIRKKYEVVGVDIDVFPIDSYPENKEESVEWSKKISKIHEKLYKRLYRFDNSSSFFKAMINNSILSLYRFLDDVGICSVKRMIQNMNVLSQKYNTSHTNFAGVSCTKQYGPKKRNKKEVFASSVQMQFEDGYYPVPVGYDEFLTNLFGDYMKLPPIEERKPHHRVKAYWK